MNKKFSRLLEPNLKLYFLCLLLFAAVTVPVQPLLAAAEGAVTVAMYLFFRSSTQKRKQGILQYINSLTGSVDAASKSTLINSPLPIMVFRPDTGEIIWSNEDFLQLVGVREHLFEIKVEDTVPGMPVAWLLEGKQECPDRVVMNNRRFRVYGSLVRAKDRDGTQNLVATTYWVDTTEYDAMREKFELSRPVVALLNVDNYEELMKVSGEAQRSAIQAQIDEKLAAWAVDTGLLVKTNRDRYLLLTEEKDYAPLVAEKFSVLDSMREIGGEGSHPTLSIGVGREADGMAELYKNASLSLEMALSRGGDQAVVRGKLDFEFYGGRTKSPEKRTKVKSRVMANALGELMSDARQVYIMGHSFADMDAVGAAAGLCCAARKLGKHPQVVIDLNHNAAEAVLEKLRSRAEYAGVFVGGSEALLRMQPGALLIVVDTNRPDFVESPAVLEACNRVAVIDHHPRAASYIENAALNFHEPYASSASELVTELLQYLVEPSDLLPEEGEALLAGIVLDTKHFTMRTGGRTFEAAAFLRRAGADTSAVQRLFQNDLTEMVSRYDIIRQAELYRDDIAVATVTEDGVERVAAAQAADELLTLKGVQASFVIYRDGESVLDINVQVILETLGGGGNSTTAGGRVEDSDPETVREKLLEAVDDYLKK